MLTERAKGKKRARNKPDLIIAVVTMQREAVAKCGCLQAALSLSTDRQPRIIPIIETARVGSLNSIFYKY